MMRFRAENGAIREQIAPLKANQIARTTSNFKMDLIKDVILINLCIHVFSIYTLSDLGVLSNLIGSLSLLYNEHYSPPTE